MSKKKSIIATTLSTVVIFVMVFLCYLVDNGSMNLLSDLVLPFLAGMELHHIIARIYQWFRNDTVKQCTVTFTQDQIKYVRQSTGLSEDGAEYLLQNFWFSSKSHDLDEIIDAWENHPDY